MAELAYDLRYMRACMMQAKDLDEAAILAVLRERPQVGHTHWTGGTEMPRVWDPTHPDAPGKVLLAKLRSMKRRGAICGCGCGCRGDWRM